MSGLCRCSHFQLSTLTGFTVLACTSNSSLENANVRYLRAIKIFVIFGFIHLITFSSCIMLPDVVYIGLGFICVFNGTFRFCLCFIL